MGVTSNTTEYKLAHIGLQKTFHHNSLGRKKLHYSHQISPAPQEYHRGHTSCPHPHQSLLHPLH
jgi:hypothetical protein